MKFATPLLSLLLLPSALASYCSGVPDPNAVLNTSPILKPSIDATAVVKSVPNGVLMVVNQEEGGDNSFYVTHLYGTPYEQGVAHGSLLSEEITDFFVQTYDYLVDQIAQSAPSALDFPDWFIEKVVEGGLDFALDWTYEATVDFTPQAFFDELQGVAEGSGCDYLLMRRIHMLPEATKGHCSMFGASKSATESGNLLQLRALDWDVDGPFRDHASVIVYHNDDEAIDDGRVSWVNVAFTGFVGSITGFNAQQISMSEIGVSFPDDTFGAESRHGTPFANVIRNVLETTSTLEEADAYITATNRTCDLILGVGDSKDGGSFNGVQYSASIANFVTPENWAPVNDTWHAPIDDVVYFGMVRSRF
jgi:isopenicillin-N N-acyltransferase-like protein